jgi:hypothetical protein
LTALNDFSAKNQGAVRPLAANAAHPAGYFRQEETQGGGAC